MKIGADLSHWNTFIPEELSFYFIKATEGATYIDPKMEQWLETIAQNYILTNRLPIIGFYHYAKPLNNKPEQEAKHFLDTVKEHIGSCLLALDWEETKVVNVWSCKQQLEWIHAFFSYVNLNTPATCILYSSRSVMSRLIDNGLQDHTPLWCADYNKHENYVESDLYPRKFAFRQFTDYPVDLDYTFLAREELVRLANRNL